MALMRRVLYIISRGPSDFSPDLLPSSPPPDAKAVLLHDALRLTTLPFSQVYALSDPADEQGSSPFPRISYRDLLRMIFEAETVVAL